MSNAGQGVSTKYTFEENRIIIESNDQELLHYIKTELLTRKTDAGSGSGDAAKFVEYCWRRSRMRNVLAVLAKEKRVSYSDIFKNFKGAFGKRRGLSGVMSGFTRNAARAGLKKDWVRYEDTPEGGFYAIDEKLYPAIKSAVAKWSAQGR